MTNILLPKRVARHSGASAPVSDKPEGVLLTPGGILVPNVIRRRGGKKDKEVELGPKQVPIDEQSGVYLDRSIMDQFNVDSLGRDVFSIDERIREWEETEELYDINKDAPIPIDPNITHLGEFGIYLNGGDMGQGKSHPEGTRILMHDGSIKEVQNIVPGDFLMGPDSQPRTVKDTHKHHGPIYRITPNRGDPWECNDIHMLTLVRTNVTSSRRGKLLKSNGEIIDVPLNEYLNWSVYQKHVYKLFRVGVDFPWQPELPVEPYLLGLLLGDWSMLHSANPKITTAHQEVEVIEYCEQVAPGWDCAIDRRAKSNTTDAASDYYFVVKDQTANYAKSNKLREALKQIGVWGHRGDTKFVPQRYKTASRGDRLEILAGLLDSDGSLEASNCFRFASVSAILADDVSFIARSLGLAAYISAMEYKNHSGSITDGWRVTISGHINIIPCKLARKQAHVRKCKQDVLRTGFKAEYNRNDDYYGFILDGDGRYLLGDFTVTHNTLWAAFVARHYRRRGWNVFSTAGLLFGQRLRLAESYAFPDHVTPGGFIFADEVHTLVDRYSSNSVRSRTFGQSSTAMRKERIGAMGASAHTIMVGWEFKGVTERVIVPRRWYPGGKLHAPPFCYIEIVMLHPFPYRRKDQLLMDAGLVRGADDMKKARWRPAPQEMMAAAKLMDSFESVKIGENFGLGAKEMQASRDGGGGGGGGDAGGQSGSRPNLVWVIKRVWEAGYIREGQKVYFTTIRDILSQAGLAVSTTNIRSALEMVGCPVSSNTVNEDDLRILFENIDNEQAQEES